MIIIGSDHAGFAMKEAIKEYLAGLNYLVEDVGTFNEDSVDYPDFAKKVAKKVQDSDNLGILICGTGIGMSISANRFVGVRCALCHDAYTAEFARKHNNANILAFGGRTTGLEIAKQMVYIFLNTSFEGGRHQRRVNKIDTEGEE
ncbi:MAG: ribose 5-phosphate isomerase B [Desulfurella sp.]|jgi:ribose 5-phosphate isomerase B|uniref:Ribose 5-phosphate isomerase B n=1 Tax=Desulfurella multipotens TaxID=79269 RepID=A0A1G6QPC4_9BACT|nr:MULTISPECIES: ribose 5-phosphate isomerase B [Desulfurella]HEX13909.1 ribose 5-phosphate isomerase B [Desulfurella acetivorans]PMP64095.1 MAG: ribose 5-phosphate isomerase B [Desulfurella multipotens]PMP87820.1 MAG: ribose 5-phosphate isomerase B [Desulfurella sp.]PMP92027.1 MAG: ribose 5-phosphate isomerase B [Desulfurella sp.]SDC94101.1 ribose 5-phosphate isomerase B [Desulfurella multipotens]